MKYTLIALLAGPLFLLWGLVLAYLYTCGVSGTEIWIQRYGKQHGSLIGISAILVSTAVWTYLIVMAIS